MTAQITETLKGLGSFVFSFRQDGDVAPAINHHEHIHVYEGEDLIHTAVILEGKSGRGESFGGCGVEWWLGQDNDGPIIVDREYISGRNKLSNGGFEDEDLLWRPDESPLWVIRSVGGEPRTGSWAAALTGAPTDDEIMQSDESFEIEPGNLIGAFLYCKRTAGTLGRLRLRIVFEGRFRPTSLLDGNGWTDESDAPGDAFVDFGDLVLGPVTRRQVVVNGGFETGDLTNWNEAPVAGDFNVETSAGLGGLGTIGSPHVLTLTPFGTSAERVLSSATSYPVVPGEKLFLQFFFSPWADWPVPGSPTHADGFMCLGALTINASAGNPINHQTPTVTIDDVSSPGWAVMSIEFEVEADQAFVFPFIRATEMTVGKWAFDDIIITHLERNTAVLRSPAITVQPKRTYRLLASVNSNTQVQTGNLKAVVTFTATGRTPIVQDSAAIEPTLGVDKLFSHDFTVPSGYTTAQIDWVATDVSVDGFRIRRSSISFRDTDEATMWVDAVQATNPAAYTQLVNNTTAPDGVERFHLELVAEAGDAGWRVDDVDVHRREATSDAEDIVDDLLRDPDTGQYLVQKGTVHAAGLINYDWHLRNLTDREALKHLSTSGLAGDREWVARPDGSIDWGTAAELFTDREDVVLADNDLILLDAPEYQTDSRNQVTRVKIIGADRTPVGGVKRIITGEATASPGSAVDWFGNPLSRTRIIEDSTIETPDHAAGRAELELDDVGRQAQPITARLADYRIAGTFDVGDWIYVHSTVAGIVDETNPVERGGRTLFPARKRVLARTRKLGAGFRVELRRFDGSIEDITRFIDWEKKTSATVDVGDLIPAFVADSEGGDLANQFRRYRASTGR